MILRELRRRPDIDLQIVVGGSAVLDRYGEVLSVMKKDGFPHNARLTFSFEGGDSIAMAKTAGIGISEFATVFDNLKPDIVVIRGDRYEVLSAAVASAYLNIPVAHLEGGDVTGTIDESVRHAVTKLAHIHFVTNDLAKERVIRMGEDPSFVFNFGCPEVEYLSGQRFRVSNALVNKIGVGDIVDMRKPYLVVMTHPVTTEGNEQNGRNARVLLEAIHELGIPTVWFWPNADAGTDAIASQIRVWREKKKPEHMRFLKYLPADQFVGLLSKATCLIGNSSAGIKECSYLGIPVVNIGTRQHGRMRGPNVIDVGYGKASIQKAIDKQIARGKYESSGIYHRPGTSKNIAKTLATVPLYVQKHFVD